MFFKGVKKCLRKILILLRTYKHKEGTLPKFCAPKGVLSVLSAVAQGLPRFMLVPHSVPSCAHLHSLLQKEGVGISGSGLADKKRIQK